MKKPNNRYHSNNNNNNNNNNGNYYNSIYSLNYKFDSISPAGKCCGSALDLIKRYNDLAKEAHGNGNYTEAEVFRQYAEHYRKIVTDINERKNQRQNTFDGATAVAAPTADAANAQEESAMTEEAAAPESQNVAQQNNQRPRRQPRQHFERAPMQADAPQAVVENNAPVANAAPVAPVAPIANAAPAPAKREFKVIEISAAESKAELIEETAKPEKEVKSPRRKTLSVAVL